MAALVHRPQGHDRGKSSPLAQQQRQVEGFLKEVQPQLDAIGLTPDRGQAASASAIVGLPRAMAIIRRGSAMAIER